MNNLIKIKNDFPIFKTYPELVYMDSSATSQKPKAVIDAVNYFYTRKNSNIHRGVYKLAETATEVYENTRIQVGKFINAKSSNEIIFTGNTNHAINIVAYGWAKKYLNKGDIIVLSEMEHHANIVPWIRLKEEIGIELEYLPFDKDYRLDYKTILKDKRISKKIKLISLTHASNALGTVNPLEEIIAYVKKAGITAKIMIDAAQSIPHLPIDVQNLNIDFLAFSGHKMLGPTGVGVLWGKENLLDAMDPLITGSNMINTVSKDRATWAELPNKFEAGTGNLEGVAGLSAAISYLQEIGLENISNYEKELTKYGLEKLRQIPGIKLFGPSGYEDRIGIFSFGYRDIHPHDIAQILDSRDIAIRSGHHCAQITMNALGVPATARASLYLYNTKVDIDKLVEGLKLVKKILKI